MIESARFHNFKLLRNTTVPLSRVCVLVGPNGSGKSTVLAGLSLAARPHQLNLDNIRAHSADLTDPSVRIELNWGEPYKGLRTEVVWEDSQPTHRHLRGAAAASAEDVQKLNDVRDRLRTFSFDPKLIAAPVPLKAKVELGPHGENLVGVLDRLRDEHPERFEAINEELGQWLPEYDRILFGTPSDGHRVLRLRSRFTGTALAAPDLSDGSLVALSLLTLSHLGEPPSIILLEEPDRGIHPRLLRHIQDALYRLAYPESARDARPPVQVVVTTHSPYFLDLFKDHIDEVVIAQREGAEATFERLSDRPDIDQILQGEPLGEVWYTGVLGGVPAGA